MRCSLLFVLTFSMAVPAAAQTDCRKLGAVTHCFSPPAPMPWTAKDTAALNEKIFAQERAIVALIVGGKGCDAAVQKASAEHRTDLVPILKNRCK